MIIENYRWKEGYQWETTRWLVLSSFSFLFPAIYAFRTRQYVMFIVTMMNFFFSINFWRKATNSWRKTIDVLHARVSIIVLVYNGILYIREIPLILNSVYGLVSMTYCYWNSEKCVIQKRPVWYQYHMMFHVFISLQAYITLYSSNEYHKINNTWK